MLYRERYPAIDVNAWRDSRFQLITLMCSNHKVLHMWSAFIVFYLMKLINWYEHAMGGHFMYLMHSGIYCLHCLLYSSVGVWWNYPFFKGAHNICMCDLESTSQCYANSNRMWWRCQSLWHSIQRVSDAATYDPQLTVWTLYPIISVNIESPSKSRQRCMCTAV